MACCGNRTPIPPVVQVAPLPTIWSFPSTAGLAPLTPEQGASYIASLNVVVA